MPCGRRPARTFHLHRDDLPILRAAPERVREWLGAHVEPIEEPEAFLEHGHLVKFGAESLEVRFTPGHAPGHVIFVDHNNRQIFAGDTLFRGSIGRFDLPLADGPTLLHSIRTELLTLADEYVVYPGHGEATTIGAEREGNPFVGRGRDALFSLTGGNCPCRQLPQGFRGCGGCSAKTINPRRPGRKQRPPPPAAPPRRSRSSSGRRPIRWRRRSSKGRLLSAGIPANRARRSDGKDLRLRLWRSGRKGCAGARPSGRVGRGALVRGCPVGVGWRG